jgi:predicted KAP-like P-loop ATPase
VVIVDDIDRLDEDEIAILFKLVKLVADFDYTAYVLAFDNKAVAFGLKDLFGGDADFGQQFIEKIVQVPLPLPKASAVVLRALGLKGIVESLEEEGVSLNGAEMLRLTTAFDDWVRPHLLTLRTVTQLSNAVRFATPVVKDEVNPVDMVLVEAARVCSPDRVSRSGDAPILACRQGTASRHRILNPWDFRGIPRTFGQSSGHFLRPTRQLSA